MSGPCSRGHERAQRAREPDEAEGLVAVRGSKSVLLQQIAERLRQKHDARAEAKS